MYTSRQCGGQGKLLGRRLSWLLTEQNRAESGKERKGLDQGFWVMSQLSPAFRFWHRTPKSQRIPNLNSKFGVFFQIPKCIRLGKATVSPIPSFLPRFQVISQLAGLHLPMRIGGRTVITVGSFIYQTFIKYLFFISFSSGQWGDTDQGRHVLYPTKHVRQRKYTRNMSKQTN